MRHSVLLAPLAAVLISGTASAVTLNYTNFTEKIWVDLKVDTRTGHEDYDYVVHEDSALTYDNLLNGSAYTGDPNTGCGVSATGSAGQFTTLGSTVIESTGSGDFSGNANCGNFFGQSLSRFDAYFRVDEEVSYSLQASVDAITTPAGKGSVRLWFIPDGNPSGTVSLFDLTVTSTGLSNSLAGTLVTGGTYQLLGLAEVVQSNTGSETGVANYNLYFEIGDGSGGGNPVPLPGSGLLAGTALAAVTRFGRRLRHAPARAGTRVTGAGSSVWKSR